MRGIYLFKNSDNRPPLLACNVVCIEAVLSDVKVQGREGDVCKIDECVHDYAVELVNNCVEQMAKQVSVPFGKLNDPYPSSAVRSNIYNSCIT